MLASSPLRAGAVRSSALLATVIAAAALASCTGKEITGPGATSEVPGTPVSPPPIGPNGEILVSCTGNITAGLVTCGGPAGGPTIGAARDLIVGGQGVYVTLAAGAVTTTAAFQCDGTANAAKKCFAFDASVKNLIPQPMGTTDGTTAVSSGLQIFFVTGPTVTSVGGGTIAVANPDSTGIFTTSGQSAFKYFGATLGADGILSTNETSSGRTWKFETGDAVTSFAFQVYVSAPVPKPNGYVDLALTSGGAAVTAASVAHGVTQQLFATSRAAIGRTLAPAELSNSVTYASNNTAVATVDLNTGLITGVAPGAATITASVTRSSGPVITGAVAVTVTNSTPAAGGDAYSAFGNVPLAMAAPGILANDTDADGDPRTAVLVTGPAHGTLTLNADGSFTYESAAGYTGPDNFTYQATDGFNASTAATVSLTVAGMAWYVDNSASPVGADGRQTHPFTTLAGAVAASGPNDYILVKRGDGTSTGLNTGVTLKSGQLFIGQGITSNLTTTLNGTAATLLAAGTAPTFTVATGTALTLASGNTVRGFALTASSGTGILGSTFGTLTTSEMSINATAGPALDLTTGALAATTLGTLSSTTSPNTALNLNAVTGGPLVVSGGSLSDAVGSTIAVTGGTVSLTYSGSVTKTNVGALGALVNVTGHSGGTITFNTGALSANKGSGLQFSNADGTYNFNGTTTLNGGDAHVDVNTGSAGSLTLSNATVSNPSTSAPLRVNASTGTVNWNGGSLSLTTSATPQLIDIQNNTAGTVSIAANLSSSQRGVLIASNSGGSYTFSGGSKTLSTAANTAVSLLSNTGGTYTFSGGGLQITTTGSGTGFSATTGGTVTVSGAGNTISTANGTALTMSGGAQISGTGLTFQSISKGTGGSNGIFLSGTGTLGGLTVTGNGGSCQRTPATCTGGTIGSTTGSDGATAGIGVYLSNVGAVSLTRMRINGVHDNFGIYGNTVRGLTLDAVLMDGTYGTSFAQNEGVASFDELSTTAAVSNSYFAGGVTDNFRVHNAASGTTLNRLTFTSDTIGFTNTAALSGDGIKLMVDAGTTNVTVTTSTFLGAYAHNVVGLFTGGSADLIVDNNGFGDGQANTSANFNHVRVFANAAGAGGNVSYDIKNNVLNNSRAAAVSVEKREGTQTVSGSITNNTIGSVGAANSGSLNEQGILVEHSGQGMSRALISNNQVFQYNSGAGIMSRFLNTSVAAHNGSLHLTITGNTVSTPGNMNASVIDGISLLNGGVSTDTYTACIKFGIGGANSIANGGRAAQGGAPYSIGPISGIPTPALNLKFASLGSGPYTGHAGEAPVDAIIRANNTVGATAGFLDFGTAAITRDAFSGGGATCTFP